MTKFQALPTKESPGRYSATGGLSFHQRGSHIRLQKHLGNETLKLTIPAHRPIKRTTLAHILKQARMTPERFAALL